MELKKIENRLSRLVTLVEGWKSAERVSRIERDMALEELRRIYDELLDYDSSSESSAPVKVAVAVEEEVESAEEPEPEVEAAESVSDLGDAFDDALDIDALLGLSSSDEEPEPILAPTPEPEPTPEPAPKPESVPEPKKVGGLFDIDDIPVRTKAGRKMIALYNNPVTQVEPKPEVEAPKVEEPKAEEVAPVINESVVEPAPVEAPKRLADVLNSGVTVLGDKMAGDDAPTTPFNRITDLRKAIGINDKFLMIRDLFGGDADKYEDTIDTLNEFEDLDECMIYIVENFRWNPDSEGAKLLVSLIERKLA